MIARFLLTASTEMQAIAVAWQICGLTHRPLDLGLVGLAQFFPGILLFPITGHTADRIPRRRILITCYAAFAFCSALLLTLAIHGLKTDGQSTPCCC
jgi:MFS family permease